MAETYEYRSRDRTGKIVTGTLLGDNPQLVADRLRRMGMTPINVKPQKVGLRTEIVLRPGHVDLKDIAIFCRQFATMVTAGLPVLRCLSVLADQTESPELAKVLVRVRSDVEAGAPLTEAMKRHPKTFSNLIVAMVRTGETTGMLGDVLAQLSTQIEREVMLRGKVRSAMSYPIAVLGLVTVILIAMLLVVVPQFKTIYAELDAELPLMTRVLLGISAAFQSAWWIIFGGVIAGVWALRRWIKTSVGRLRFDAFKIGVPIFGPLFQKVAIARFANTLALLLRAGVPLLQSLEVVKETVNNRVIANALDSVKGRVREGETLSGPLSTHEVFPPMVVQMMSVGEDSGAVDEMMGKVADFYNEEVSASVDALTSLIEPLLIIVIGVVVGLAVVSLYLPMFNIINLIQ